MNFRDLIESYNKELGQVFYVAKESGDIRQIHGNSDFLLTFDYKGKEWTYQFKDSSTKGIEKAFAKLFNTNKIPEAYNDDMETIKNIKISDVTNINYEIN